MKIVHFFIFGIIPIQVPPLIAQQLQDSLPTISLQEVQVQGLRAEKDTPVTFSNLTKEELAVRNLGQDNHI